jgi:hypothetical protein
VYYDTVLQAIVPGTIDFVTVMGVDGDYNDDGTVDAADYVTWRKNQGTSNPLPNDPHGGLIGANQYNTWRANFGMSEGSGSGLAAGSVPEPASWWLAVVTMFLVASGRLVHRARPARCLAQAYCRSHSR